MRYERVLPRVRLYVEAERKKKTRALWPGVVAREMKLPQPVVTQCFAVLVQDGALEPRKAIDPRRITGGCGGGHSGYYEVRNITREYGPLPHRLPEQPKKRKVRWGTNARRILASIRLKTPWVIEKWYPEDERWYMYMESGCDRDPMHKLCTDSKPVAPELQSKLRRKQIAAWHFTAEEAIERCGRLRKWRPATYRTRDTTSGDYVMGDILL